MLLFKSVPSRRHGLCSTLHLNKNSRKSDFCGKHQQNQRQQSQLPYQSQRQGINKTGLHSSSPSTPQKTPKRNTGWCFRLVTLEGEMTRVWSGSFHHSGEPWRLCLSCGALCWRRFSLYIKQRKTHSYFFFFLLLRSKKCLEKKKSINFHRKILSFSEVHLPLFVL